MKAKKKKNKNPGLNIEGIRGRWLQLQTQESMEPDSKWSLAYARTKLLESVPPHMLPEVLDRIASNAKQK